MKFWTCVQCGCSSDYDFCDDCEAAVIAAHESARIDRERYYEDLERERQGQYDPRD